MWHKDGFEFYHIRGRRSKTFNKCVKDQFRIGINPNTIVFPVSTTSDLLRRVKMHKLFIDLFGAILPTTKPENIANDKNGRIGIHNSSITSKKYPEEMGFL